MSQSGNPKRLRGLSGYAAAMGITLLGALVAGIAGGLLADLPGPVGLGLTVASISVAMAIGFAACLWWWRGIDEAAREAHKWAWWWGGSGGMAVGLVVLITLTWRDDAALLPAPGLEVADVFAAGVFAILLFQVAGYTLAWAGWWLKHR